MSALRHDVEPFIEVEHRGALQPPVPGQAGEHDDRTLDSVDEDDPRIPCAHARQAVCGPEPFDDEEAGGDQENGGDEHSIVGHADRAARSLWTEARGWEVPRREYRRVV